MRPSATLLLATLTGCAAAPPSGWQFGGSPLVVPQARWVYGEVAVDVDADGRVRVAGDHRLTIDRAGRVYDPYNRPVALLLPDGMLVGGDDESLGWVGAGRAILPGGEEPWLQILPSGEAVRTSDDGERPFGVWLGCQTSARALQACTLVTHLIGLRLREREQSDVSVGVGLGVTVPLR